MSSTDEDSDPGGAVTTRTDLAKKYLEAQQTRDAGAIDAIADALTDDATLVSPRGSVDGKAAIVDRLKNPPQYMGGGGGGGGGGGMMGQIQWGEPEEAGAVVQVSATLPPNPMMQGMTLALSFTADDKIEKIEMVMQR